MSIIILLRSNSYHKSAENVNLLIMITGKENIMATAAKNLQSQTELTEELASWSSHLSLDQVPENALTNAKHCLLDWLGVALAGAQDKLVDILHQTAEMDGLGNQANLIGRKGAASASQAALINGAAGHALDYDDVVRIFRGHPTAPVAPAVLAIGERDNHQGAEILLALIAGIEVESRIGGYMGDSHYLKGWHATGTTGHFGSAAATAKLLKLDAEATANAFGISGTQASGLKANFGTMCKPLHAGKAAMNGLLSAEWAKRGFTSRQNIVERVDGFGENFEGECDVNAALEGLGEKFHLTDLLFKYHAACYGVHSPIECAKRISKNPAFRVERVTKIEVRHAARLKGMCDQPKPETGLEIKFSLYMTTAMALAGLDTGRLDVYSRETAKKKGLIELRDKVKLIAENTFTPNQSEVIVHQDDGTVIRETDDLAKPNRDLSGQWEKLSSKFRALAVPLVGEKNAENTIASVWNLENQTSLLPVISPLRSVIAKS